MSSAIGETSSKCPNTPHLSTSNIQLDSERTQRVHALSERMFTIGSERHDQRGNKLRLWELKGSGFFGTVVTPEGKIVIIRQENIVNPLIQGSCVPALHRIKAMQTFSLNLFSDGQKPLHIAVKLGWKPGVKILVNALGIEINALDSWDKTPLDDAIEANEYDIGEFLINNGAVSKKHWITMFRAWNPGKFLLRKVINLGFKWN